MQRHLISAADLSLFKVTSNVEEAVEEVTSFYRLYHSSRFVNEKFVVRLMRPVEPEHVVRWANDFSDLLLGEGIEMRGALDEEHAQEPDLDNLPRLVMRYDPG